MNNTAAAHDIHQPMTPTESCLQIVRSVAKMLRDQKRRIEAELKSNQREWLRLQMEFCPHQPEDRIVHERPCAEADTWIQCGVCDADVTKQHYGERK